MSVELVEALRRQPGMMQTALTQAVVGHARVITSLGQECDMVTESCTLHLTIEIPWGPVRFSMPFIVLPEGSHVVIIRQKTLRGKRGIDVMAQLKISVLKAHGMAMRWRLQLLLWASPTLAPCCGRRWPSRRLGRAATRQVTWTMMAHGCCRLNGPRCSRIPRWRCRAVWVCWRQWPMTMLTMAYRQNVRTVWTISFLTRIFFRRALLGDPPARVEPNTVRLQSGARAVLTTPRASSIAHIPGDENCWGDLLSRG